MYIAEAEQDYPEKERPVLSFSKTMTDSYTYSESNGCDFGRAFHPPLSVPENDGFKVGMTVGVVATSTILILALIAAVVLGS